MLLALTLVGCDGTIASSAALLAIATLLSIFGRKAPEAVPEAATREPVAVVVQQAADKPPEPTAEVVATPEPRPADRRRVRLRDGSDEDMTWRATSRAGPRWPRPAR